MVYLLRIFALFMLCSGFAHAGLPLVQLYTSPSVATGKTLGPASASSICSQQVAGMSGSTTYTYSAKPRQSPVGACDLLRNDGAVSIVNYYGAGSSCPANSSVSGTECVCNSGYLEQGGQCISKQDPNVRCAGDFVLSGFGVGSGKLVDTQIMKGEIPSGEMCWPHDTPGSGCTVNFVQDKVVGLPDGSKQTYGRIGMYSGPAGTTQGKACEIADPGHEVSADCKTTGMIGNASGGRAVCADPPKCPGGFGGEVNGVEVCVKDDGANVVKSEKETVTKKPDGSTEKVTEKTSCQGKTCTTEKTSTNTPAGGGSSTTNVTNVSQSKDDYCKNNADSAQCKGDGKGDGGGSFGGSCEGGFACEGDTLQCAQLREQYKRNCEMMDKDKDSNSLTNKALNGTDDKSADAMKESAGQVNVGSTFDQSGLGWGSSCPADPQIQLNFGSQSYFTIPFSRICGPLGVLSLAGVGITLLGCGVWVLGGKKGS